MKFEAVYDRLIKVGVSPKDAALLAHDLAVEVKEVIKEVEKPAYYPQPCYLNHYPYPITVKPYEITYIEPEPWQMDKIRCAMGATKVYELGIGFNPDLNIKCGCD